MGHAPGQVLSNIDDFYRDRDKNRLALADAYRKNQIDHFEATGKNIQDVLSAGQVLDPKTQQLRPLTPEEQQNLTQAQQQITKHIQNLYNPSFDPATGFAAESPIHKLTDMLHLTKKPTQQKTKPEQMADLQGIVAKYETQAPGTAEARSSQMQESQRKQKIDAAVKAMKEAGATDDEIKQFQVRASEAAAGVRTSTTQRFYRSPDGKQADWFIPGEQPQGWIAGSPSQMTQKAPKLTFRGNQAFLTDPSTGKLYSQGNISEATPELQTIFANATKAAEAVRHTVGTHQIQVPQKDGSILLMPVEVESTSGYGPSGKSGEAKGKPKSVGEQKKDLAAFKGRIVGGRENSVDRQMSKEYGDTNAAYQQAVDRQKVMHKNADDAKKGDQQAMLSLVANHIGMTLGAQKGARINQAVWNEAIASAPWMQALAAKFDDRGYLSGVTLTPEQVDQMVRLADEKVEVMKEHLGRSKANLPQGSPQDMSDDDFLKQVTNAAKPRTPKQ